MDFRKRNFKRFLGVKKYYVYIKQALLYDEAKIKILSENDLNVYEKILSCYESYFIKYSKFKNFLLSFRSYKNLNDNNICGYKLINELLIKEIEEIEKNGEIKENKRRRKTGKKTIA